MTPSTPTPDPMLTDLDGIERVLRGLERRSTAETARTGRRSDVARAADEAIGLMAVLRRRAAATTV